MKKVVIFVLIGIMLFSITSYGEDFTSEEIEWLNSHKEETLYLGAAAHSGMEYFEFRGNMFGYLIDIKEILETELGINIEFADSLYWSEVYKDFLTNEVDILFGANMTEERLEFMSFTKPIYKYPYAVFTNKDSSIRTIGDLDKKRVGFTDKDVAIQLFNTNYKNIDIQTITFDNQFSGFDAMLNKEIDAFITSGGSVKYLYLSQYPEILLITELSNITSDLTFSVKENNEQLVCVISKILEKHRLEINKAIRKSEIIYNRKVMNFSDDELKWLEENGTALVGVAEDYLPLDYYEEESYLGITGQLLKEIEKITGIEFIFKKDSFSNLYGYIVNGEIDVLNIAKSAEREKYIIYPRPFSEERDQIFGLVDSPFLENIYQLENIPVAVIEGFWHEEYLKKNLINPNIVITKNIEESLKLLSKGKVKYFIENPTVAKFYIDGLGYKNIINKGNTSSDSFLYLGITNSKPELASIIDKSIKLVNYDVLKEKGIATVPKLSNKDIYKWIYTSIFLFVAIFFLFLILYKIFRELVEEKAKSKILEEREALIYIDGLTKVKNRMYYNKLVKEIDKYKLPQCFIVMDLDNFKQVNDTYGHIVGDKIIIEFSNHLKKIENIEIIRTGGDEFLIFISSCTYNQALKIMEKLNKTMNKISFEFEGCKIQSIYFSFGIAIREDSSQKPDKMIQIADKRMYKQKSMKKVQR